MATRRLISCLALTGTLALLARAAAIMLRALRERQERHRELLCDAAAATAQLELLAAVPGHEDHLRSVQDAIDELEAADDDRTLIASLRQLRLISRRAHAIATGAEPA